MKIVHLVPGSGGSFYCQNCVRDGILIRALRQRGHDVVLVPLYLPLFDNAPEETDQQAPVFYGALNIYLSQKLPFAAHLPSVVRHFLNSAPMLRAAARLAGVTRSAGLEDLTLSMLKGEEGRQAFELDQLVDWLSTTECPDAVHFSNALLLGMAPRIRAALGARLVCSLQDEDVWLGPMPAAARRKAIDLLREHARQIDAFVAPSHYYARTAGNLFKIPAEQIRVIPPGLQLEAYQCGESPTPPVLGFLSRLSAASGLEALVNAFIELRQDTELQDLRLHLCGGTTGDDRPFVKRQFARLRRAGVMDGVRVFEKLDLASRCSFLQGLSVLSVPCPAGEAFGLQIAEAMACGVPCVQPNVGAYPELIKSEVNGILYEFPSKNALTEALRRLLRDSHLRHRMGANARKDACERFNPNKYADAILRLYTQTTHKDS
ncbi:MAG: glycosyltransferase family 4 protein [Verrucomicrobiota bacterium]